MYMEKIVSKKHEEEEEGTGTKKKHK